MDIDKVVLSGYDLILDDGKEKIGLIAVPDADALGRNPVDQSSLKTSVGDQKFSDLKPPYTIIAQNDWTGGRAAEELERDNTRYRDGLRANTEHSIGVIMGGRETYSTGLRSDLRNLPGNMRLQALIGWRRFLARRFLASATWNANCIWMWVRRKGTPKGSFTARLRSGTITTPETVLKTVNLPTSNAPNLVSEFQIFAFTVQGITAGNYYWIEAVGAVGDDNQNHWEVGVLESGGATKRSIDGTNYANINVDLYCRVTNADKGKPGILFQYKKAQYFVDRPSDNSASSLWINGARGVAVSNAGQMNKLIAATAHGLAINEAVGATILIIEGNGFAEEQNWRTITANDATSFTVDQNWLIQHNSTTTWVVLGLNNWTEINTIIQANVTAMSYILKVVTLTASNTFNVGDAITVAGVNAGFTVTNIDGNWICETGTNATTIKFTVAVQPTGTTPQTITVGTVTKAAITKPVTDVHISSGGFAYLCQGEKDKIARMKEEGGSAWTRTFANEASKAVFMTEYYNNGYKLVRTNEDGTASEAVVPVTWANIESWVYPVTVTALSYKKKIVSLAADNEFKVGDRITVAGVNAGFTVTNIDGNWTCRIGTNTAVVKFAVTTQPTGTTPQTMDAGTIQRMPGPVGDKYDRVTGIRSYKDYNLDDAVVIFKEAGPWMWKNWIADEMRTKEMSAIAAAANGRASNVQGVYLFFSVLNTVWRFYHPNFDDIGPTNDLGLPVDRQGPISAIVAYPGRIIIAIDGGNVGYSAVFTSPGSANFCEIYRAPRGERIRALDFQVIAGALPDRLWIHQGADIIYIPYPSNTYDPFQDPNYPFAHEFVLEFTSISAGLYTTWKYWKDLQLRTKNLKSATPGGSSVTTWLEADYRFSEDDDWTTFPEEFTESDVQEQEFNKEFGVSSQILYLRIRGYSNDMTESPKLTAVAISCITVVAPKFSYQLMVQALYRDKNGNKGMEPWKKIRKLDEWCGEARPLRLYTTNPLYHDIKVFLLPLPTRPIQSAERVNEHEYQCSITLQEA